MKIRRINRTTEQPSDTYTIQIQYSASDIKDALIKAYSEDGIAEEIINCPLDWIKNDIANVISVMDLKLGTRTNFDKWLVSSAKAKGYIIPTTGGRWKPNKEILRLKTGRTSARVQKMLDE